ncbi:glycoside hydrolase family 3 C-terminal domain-containing protein [Paenibacillus sp. DYY-L-2]|uniref:glycoside hydrolase family 3 C-terminal domain-containing protein n=1 Tax=Paenibacillus sp. DYY-L-2 TaxID=3447013 RepID=UPI003F4F9144
MDQTKDHLHDLPMWNADLALEDRLDDMLSRLTLDEKIGLMPSRQEAVPRLGIPEYGVGGEAAHGFVAREGPATVFPQTIGLSSTWNPELLQEIGELIGDEARSYYEQRGGSGGLTVWAPTVDLERDPRWGRTEEAYGEDPYLTGILATSLVRGMHGDHPFYIKMVPALKHFYANNNERDRLKSSSSIDPRNKREYYLKAYERAVVEGRVHSLMTAYNSINGVPAIGHPDVKGVLKEEWKLDGFVVCDGADMHMTVDDHKYCRTYAEAVAFAIKGGIDCVTDDSALVKDSIREALGQGLLAEEDLDHAIRNVFRIRFRLGQFDPQERNPYAQIPATNIHHPSHRATALKAAREAVVLLKNERGTLPLEASSISRAAVIGPLADVVYRDWYTGHPPYVVTPLQGIVAALAGARVDFRDGDDRIAIRSDRTGMYVGTKGWDDGGLVVNRPYASANEYFRRTDWGWGVQTLRSLANGNYVTAADERKRLQATAKEIWGWFVKEQIGIVSREDGSIGIRTWNGRHVALAEADSKEPELIINDSQSLLSQENGTDPEEATSFRLETVSDGIEEAVKAAREADVAIVFAGNHPLINGKEEIDRPGLTLPEHQERLIRAVHEANPNTVLVIVGSYPFALNGLEELVPAIIYTAHGCQELGTAVADVLFGRYNPAGRLSMTWYRSEEQLPDIMDYDIIKGKRTYRYFDGDPLYPFGYGLSYSTFEYTGLRVKDPQPLNGEHFTVEFNVENTGELPGDEVVQLYVRSGVSRVIRPQKQLIGFRRVHLQPAQRQKVEFTVPVSELAFWDVTRERYCVESGEYMIMAGASSEDIRLNASLMVQGETVPPRNLYAWTAAENYDDYEGLYLDEWREEGAGTGTGQINGTCIRSREGATAWAAYDDVDFQQGAVRFEARVLSETDSRLSIRIDSPKGKVIGEVVLRRSEAGSEPAWHTAACNLENVTGTQRIFLELDKSVRLSQFRFIAP